MTLERYRRKRDFRVTPEPAGGVGTPSAGALRFVVQKHAARRLHFDFRLELDGVLLSWAVPRGPSLDPNDKRLAVHVEDHPLEYGEFEGVIPQGQYGAGTVMVWDRGTWTPRGDARATYAKGHLKFELRGEKLAGTWNLVRSGKANEWLLFKEADDAARLGAAGLVDVDRPASVLTGRSLEEIAAKADRVWHSNRSVADNVRAGAVRRSAGRPLARIAKIAGARKAPLPDTVEPQLATPTKHPPAGEHWVHEVKHDGYRMLCRIAGGQARMHSRTGKDWTADFPSLVQALARLPVDSAWIDGEVVVLDAQGRSSFQALQNALAGAAPPALAYFAFDLLYLDGVDLRDATLVERKRVLHELLEGASPGLRYSEHFAVPGAVFLENVATLGLEGMVSKRADLPYRSGRSPAWQKVKCARRETFVVGGYTEPEGSRHGFGALLVGLPQRDGTLTYCGRVGSGFNDAALANIARTLASLGQPETPFHNPPSGADARRARWVRPTLVAEVSYGEWTADRTLRHPVFVGLRADQSPEDLVKAASAPDPPPDAVPAPADRNAPKRDTGKPVVASIAIGNPDKLLYPEAGLAKLDLARYYESVGERMLREIRGRPLTLVRYPNGWQEKGFHQKHAEASVPDVVSRVRVDAASVHMMVESVPAIVALLQLGALEIHPWGSRVPHIALADRIVLDLDPDEGLAWDAVQQATLVVRTLVESIGLAAFVKTTGGKGLHVVVPIEPTQPWEVVKGFSKAIAELLERTFPDRFTSKLLKISRGGRVFVDYLRNAEGSTAIGAYSLRARAGAPVATPIAWTELGRDVRFAHFNARTVLRRLARMKTDPWQDIDAAARPLTTEVMTRVGYRADAEARAVR